jgi:hypothetical protein
MSSVLRARQPGVCIRGGGDAREVLLEREARGDVARADDEVERVRERLVEVALRDDDVVRAELLDVLDLVLGRRERGDLRAERVREEDGVVALRTSSVLGARSKRRRGEMFGWRVNREMVRRRLGGMKLQEES